MGLAGRVSLVFVLLWLSIGTAMAQLPGGGVNQSGTVTNGNCTKWLGSGVIADSGGPCGGTGSPGGTSGQVQYNNAGSFGGFTVGGDGTLNTGTGGLTVTKTNGTSFGALATAVPGTGVATLLTGAASGTGGPAGTTSPTFGTGVTFGFITGSTQCLHVNTSGVLSGTGSDCGSASGVTSVTPGAALVSSVTVACSQSAITTSGTLSAAECLNAQVGTSYAIVDGDRGKLITGTNSATQAYTIAQAGAASAFQSGWYVRVQNKGTGPLTITPTTSTIGGLSVYTVFPGQTIKITSDGTNYQVDSGSTGSITVNSQTGANYAFAASDFGKLVNLSNAANQIPTIAQAGTTGFPAGWYTEACNQGAGTQTITPTTSTIGGAATYVLAAGSAKSPTCIAIVSDGSNYQVVPEAQTGTVTGALKASSGGAISQAACADLSNGATGCSTPTGTSGATLPLLNGTNTWSGTQTFGTTVGTVTTQSGTTYTFASTDCGTTVRFTSASAVTATIPQGLAVGCVIAVEQAGAGQVAVNGSAVTPATLHSAHSYTKTSAQWAVIGIFTESSNVAVLTGDGA